MMTDDHWTFTCSPISSPGHLQTSTLSTYFFTPSYCLFPRMIPIDLFSSQEIVAPILLCLLGSPTLQAAPQFRGFLRSFYNFNGFPVADPKGEAEQKKKFPTIFSNGLSEVSQVSHPVRIPSGKSPAKAATAKARPHMATTRIRIMKTTARPFTTTRTYTYAPSTTTAPTTRAPITRAPTTKAPTTAAPTTAAPTTKAPTTRPPATAAPTTKAPTTKAPTTTTQTTNPPMTKVATTRGSSTEASTTKAPTTRAPSTEAPTTSPPSTTAAGTRSTVSGKELIEVVDELIEIVPAEIEIEADELVEQLLEQTSEDNSVQSVMMSEKLLEMALTRLKEMEGEMSK